jgi:signal transduction histidine kinase
MSGDRSESVGVGRRVRGLLASVRLRLVWSIAVVLAITTVVSVGLVRLVLIQRMDARIEAELVQEVREAELLATGNDPETGEPFAGDVERIFEIALNRNVPARYEVLLTFVGGELAGQGGGDDAPTLADLPIDEWAGLSSTSRGRVDLDDGRTIEFLAVPFIVDGAARGVFAVAIDRNIQNADTDAASLAAVAVGMLMLVVGTLLAARLADRILTPVREVRQTAQAISETDLSRRIDVTGEDEIAELARTFNDMLDRLDSAFATQRRFVDDAAHELRTPITVIQGHLDTLGDDPDDRTRTLALLDDELARVRRMIDDLLLLARSERPDFLRFGPADLGDLTRQVLDKARGLGDRDWVAEHVAEAVVRADEQRLTQAALQLAENAVNHTIAGSRIGIGSAVNGTEVRLWVSDTGPGIAPEDQARVFERFARGPGGRRRSEGSGLGLPIVAAIAEGHGGRVEVASAAGRGSTFTIVIPAGGPRT